MQYTLKILNSAGEIQRVIKTIAPSDDDAFREARELAASLGAPVLEVHCGEARLAAFTALAKPEDDQQAVLEHASLHRLRRNARRPGRSPR